MSKLRTMTIRHKLISIIMLTCIFALLLAGATLIVREWTTIRQRMVRNLSIQAEMIADNCKAALAFEDAKDAEETLKALHVEPSIVFGGVYTTGGEVFASYYSESADSSVRPSELREVGYSFSDDFLTVFKPIVLDEETIGTVCLQSDLRPMYVMLKNNAIIITVVLLFVSLVAYFVSSWLQKVISGPILSLAEGAALIGKGELNHRVKIQSKDELGHLAASFNDMAGKLKESYASLEKKVQERTSELSSANEKLEVEIVERKRIEAALKVSEEQYRRQFEEAMDGIFIADAETGLLLDCNAAAAELVGREETELVGQHQRILHPPEEIEGGFSRTFKQHLREKKGQALEAQVITKNGEIKDVSIKANLLEVKGRKLIQGIFRDITERKQAEEALEISNRELKDFVYVASHDLREPLRKISSFGELLKDSLEGKLNEDDQENLEFMVNGANRMTEMIEGLLTYSRVNTKGISFQAVNLNEVAEQLEQLELAVLLEETGGTIEVPQPLPVVEADPIQMRQLLQNLIANGIKYRRDEVRPRIVIRAKHTDEGKVRIEVQDNGIGIEKEYYDDIFTMFRRLHPRQRYGGTGIGLAVCRKIMDRHGGRIGVESKYGEGTTLWFTLSAASEAVAVS